MPGKSIPDELEAAGFHVHSHDKPIVTPAVLYVNDSDTHLTGQVRYPEKRWTETVIWGTTGDLSALVLTEDGKFSEATLRDGGSLWFTRKVTQFRKWLKGDREIEGLIAKW